MGLRFDPASQVTQILYQLTATSTQINQAGYAYNPVGNRTSLTDRRGAQSFGYDTLDRLTSASHPLLATPQAFAYDAVGNRTTGGSVVNAGNQLTADANHSYQYDDNGNLTRKTLLATGNYSQYTYDAENRLTKVEEFAAGNPTPFATSTYRYDGLGRRIEKVANGQTKRFIYDGEDILLEYDGANVLQARYTHGPGIDEPIAVTKGSSTFFYHQDGLGTVTDLTDSAGATAKSYSYDAYGNLVDQTGTVDQPYTYTGRELDSETGLYYYRARYYDPATGLFLQKDPIGLLGGTNNLYQYVSSSPTNWTDPSGLAKLCVSVLIGKDIIDEIRVKPPVVRRYGGHWVVPKPGLEPDLKRGIKPGIAIEVWKVDHIFRRYDQVRFYQIIERSKVVCVDSGVGPCGIPWETRMEYVEEKKSDPVETLIRTWTDYSIEKLYKLF
jgi:RHS repeat-associated protein